LPDETNTDSNGRNDMHVLILTFGPRGNIEPMVGLAVWVRALGVPCDTVPAATEGWDAQVSTGVLPRGVWR
jgi:hypothetical protein